MKKIIVTGGNGFIGSNLVKFLLSKKYFVINIDKNKYSNGSYLLKKNKNKNYRFYKLDINSYKGNMVWMYMQIQIIYIYVI